MNKLEFLKRLRKSLSGVSKKEKKERLNFYEEMIEDYIEEGLTEEQAVSKIGSTENIARQIKAEEKTKKKLGAKEINAWKTALLIVGSPIWFSLLISVVAVGVSLYASLWAVVVSLWATFISLIVGGIGGIIFFIIVGEATISSIVIVGAGVFGIGFSIFLYYVNKALTKLSIVITKKSITIIKNSFNKRRSV